MGQINVEVAYALPDRQMIIPLKVESGTTMLQAAELSGICERFPEIDLPNSDLGIFGKAERDPASRVLREGERVEIYRPLTADPKEVRKKRAEKAKAERQTSS